MKLELSIASLVLASDALTKSIVKNNLLQGESRTILPNLFHITLVLNQGAAFGLFKDEGAIFITLSLVTIFFIIVYIWKRNVKDTLLSFALGLISGGAVGNLIDRLRFGCVIDFLDFRIWPVFNIADSSITIGAGLLLWRMLRRKINQRPKCTPS